MLSRQDVIRVITSAQRLSATYGALMIAAVAVVCPQRMDAQVVLARLDPFATPAPSSDAAAGAATLVEFHLGRLTQSTLHVYDTGTDVLVPLCAVVQLAGFTHTCLESRVTSTVGVHNIPLTVDVARRTLQFGARTYTLGEQRVRSVHDVVYVSLWAVAPLLGFDPIVDRAAATITVLNVDSLPITQRFARDAARVALAASANARLPLAGAMRHTSPEWGGLSLDYTVTNARMLSMTTTEYATSLSTALAGGSLVTRATGWAGGMTTESAWERLWPTGRVVTGVRVGDGSTSDAASIRARGIFVTNAPFARPVVMGNIPFDGTLLPGWTVDAYRDGVLVGFDTAGSTGRYTLALPVHYGDNPFQVVATGPFGERIVLSRTFRALPQLLPVHKFEYAADAGRCVGPECQWGTHGEVRYGLASRWAVRAGASHYSWNADGVGLRPLAAPYMGLAGVPRDGLSLDAEVSQPTFGAVPRVRRVNVWFDPSMDVSLFAAYSEDVQSSGVEYVGATNGQEIVRQWSLNARVAPGPWHPGWEVHGVATSKEIGVRAGGRVAAVITTSAATLRPYVRVARDPVDRGTFLGVDAIAFPSFGQQMLGGWWMHGLLEAGAAATRPEGTLTTSATRAELLFAHGAAQQSHTEAGFRWLHGTRGVALTVRVIRALSGVRSSSSVDVSGRPSATASTVTRMAHVTSGSARWQNGLILSPEPVINRAGVTGTVFLDANGNGVRDSGERALSGVAVRIEGYVVQTTGGGRYEAWGISPAQDAVVSVDTASLGSPWWVPAQNVTIAQSSSNRAVPIDIPIIVGGVAEGVVVAGDSLAADPAACRVVLTHVETGGRRMVDVFSDGSWYQMGLRPGEYMVESEAAAPGLGDGCRSSHVRMMVAGGETTRHVTVSIMGTRH